MAITLCTFYTPSHEILFKEWLLPSAISCGFEVVARSYDTQLCSSGNYAETGWRDTQFKKLSNYISILKNKNDNEIIVGSDVDVQIVRLCSENLVEFLGDNDLSFQENIDKKVCSKLFL